LPRKNFYEALYSCGREVMEKKLKCLEMMGYDVLSNPVSGYVHISFKTNSRYFVSISVSFNNLEKDFSVETIVAMLNRRIKEEL
jgi:hypothetical protein